MPARTDPVPPPTRTVRVARAATVLAVALLLAGGCAQSVAGTPRAVGSSAPPTGQTDGGSTPASPSELDVVLEITGSGTALNIGYDVEKESDNLFNVPLPWRKELTVGSDTQLIQVLVAGGDAQSCRITVDGEVVAEEQVTQPRTASMAVLAPRVSDAHRTHLRPAAHLAGGMWRSPAVCAPGSGCVSRARSAAGWRPPSAGRSA